MKNALKVVGLVYLVVAAAAGTVVIVFTGLILLAQMSGAL